MIASYYKLMRDEVQCRTSKKRIERENVLDIYILKQITENKYFLCCSHLLGSHNSLIYKISYPSKYIYSGDLK